MFPEIESPVVDIIIGIMFPILGVYIILHRGKIMDVLLRYEKYFCEKLVFPNYLRLKLFNKIMIIAVAVGFASTGIGGIVDVINHVFRK